MEFTVNGKRTVVPIHVLKVHGGAEVQLHSKTSALDGGVWSTHTPAALKLGKNSGINLIGRWVSSRGDLDVSEKRHISLPLPGFGPRIVQPVA
jgi:hypothetical protein